MNERRKFKSGRVPRTTPTPAAFAAFIPTTLSCIQGTFREHSGNIQGAFREHPGNIQGTFREYPGNIQGIFR
eukprot:1196343-Prorocentrum_minimum.AAC.1